MLEQTLCLIKPDAVSNGVCGRILGQIESSGINITSIKKIYLSKEQAEMFYAEHRGRAFFEDLTTYMSSGPVFAVALKGDGAIAKYREIMGSTDPKEAKEGTIRKKYAHSKSANAVHGSDSLQSAQRELAFFFSSLELGNQSY